MIRFENKSICVTERSLFADDGSTEIEIELENALISW